MTVSTDYLDGSGMNLRVFLAYVERFKSRTGAADEDIELRGALDSILIQATIFGAEQ